VTKNQQKKTKQFVATISAVTPPTPPNHHQPLTLAASAGAAYLLESSFISRFRERAAATETVAKSAAIRMKERRGMCARQA
jgi:hypothetical protein